MKEESTVIGIFTGFNSKEVDMEEILYTGWQSGIDFDRAYAASLGTEPDRESSTVFC